MEVMLLVLVIGVFIGFRAGRMWSERSRAAFEARAAWTGRKRYRGTRPF